MPGQTPDLTVAVQDYLKAIYALESAGERVTTSALARRMGVSAPSATAMTKRLDELGLVERLPYRGVALTDAGRRGALEVLRHHRLLERYLVDRLGLSLDAVHAEAELLEHALSEELEAKIDEELGFPTHDPHGDPIPDRELRVVHARRPDAARPRARRADVDRARPGRRLRAAPLPRRARARSRLAISSSSPTRRSAAPSPCARNAASTRSRASSRTASPPPSAHA